MGYPLPTCEDGVQEIAQWPVSKVRSMRQGLLKGSHLEIPLMSLSPVSRAESATARPVSSGMPDRMRPHALCHKPLGLYTKGK